MLIIAFIAGVAAGTAFGDRIKAAAASVIARFKNH